MIEDEEEAEERKQLQILLIPLIQQQTSDALGAEPIASPEIEENKSPDTCGCQKVP